MTHALPTHYAIDFGTSNSLVAAANAEQVFPPIPLDLAADDPTILRSVLFFPDARRCFYGAGALHAYVEHGMQGRLLRSLKKHLPSRSFLGTYIEERPMRVEDLIGAILAELRRRADAHFGVTVDRVVLGRPAKFSEDPLDDAFAENRLERAARVAGFREVSFCPEPIAAAHDFRGQLREPKIVLVADFGGGTSDFTVLRLRSDAYDPSDVLSIGGVSTAGDVLDGSIMRSRIAVHFGAGVTYRVPLGKNVLQMPKPLMETLCSPADISLLRRPDARAFLEDVRGWALSEDDRQKIDRLFTLVDDALGFSVFESIERSKRTLSTSDVARFTFSYPTIEIEEDLTREGFESASEPATRRILASLDATVAAAGATFDDIDLVCATGGTAKVPRIEQALLSRFGEEKVLVHNAFHSVVLGLAERARDLARSP